MKKSITAVIWIIALIALLFAAFTFYTKNKGGGKNPPTEQSVSQSSTRQAETPQAGTDQSGTAGPDKIMAPDFALKDLDGKTIKLSDYRGKIVIVNFWATWCQYCNLEMPDLNKLSSELEKEDDAVLLAVDVQESADTVRKYLKSNKFGLKVLLDEDGEVTQRYSVSGFPTTFVINRDGFVYTYNVGATDKQSLLDILDKMKAEKDGK
jgi:peroxiredoxin